MHKNKQNLQKLNEQIRHQNRPQTSKGRSSRQASVPRDVANESSAPTEKQGPEINFEYLMNCVNKNIDKANDPKSAFNLVLNENSDIKRELHVVVKKAEQNLVQ